MSNSATFEKTSGTTGMSIRVSPSCGTLQSSIDYVLAGTSIAVPASLVAEVENFLRVVPTNYLRAIALLGIGDDYLDEEEREWDALFAQPHVQAGLDRLERKAMQQFLTGKTVEGGFAVD